MASPYARNLFFLNRDFIDYVVFANLHDDRHRFGRDLAERSVTAVKIGRRVERQPVLYHARRDAQS